MQRTELSGWSEIFLPVIYIELLLNLRDVVQNTFFILQNDKKRRSFPVVATDTNILRVDLLGTVQRKHPV